MNIQTGTLTLTLTETVARDTLRLCFDLDQPLVFVPGQFVSMEFGPKAWRAYSIASCPDEGQIELVVRLVEGGVASEIFRTAKLGQTFAYKGPFGMFGLSDTPDATLNFCATGTGIAPFRPMIMAEAAKPTPRPMRLYYGGRDAEDLAYLDQIAEWAPNLEVYLGLTRVQPVVRASNPGLDLIPGSWKPQRITAFLEEQEFTAQDEFYLCGSGPMVKSVNALLTEKGIAPSQVHQERFN